MNVFSNKTRSIKAGNRRGCPRAGRSRAQARLRRGSDPGASRCRGAAGDAMRVPSPPPHHLHLRGSRALLGQARCWPGGFWVRCRHASMVWVSWPAAPPPRVLPKKRRRRSEEGTGHQHPLPVPPTRAHLPQTLPVPPARAAGQSLRTAEAGSSCADRRCARCAGAFALLEINK